MKLSRRGIFGAAAGAIVAGPSAVNAAMEAKSATPIGYGSTLGAKIAGEREYLASQLAKARRIAMGDIRDEDMGPQPCEGRQPFESLRSVSPEARVFIRQRFYERRYRVSLIERAKAALAEYDRTGFMRHLL